VSLPNPPSDSPAHILVIEDDPTARAMLGAWLHTEGHTYELCGDGASARALLEDRSFDLAICDIDLPDSTGPEVIASVSGRNRGLPVIFLTGAPTLDSAVHSIRLRAAAYLLKPPNLDELRDLVLREAAMGRLRRTVAREREQLAHWSTDLAALEMELRAGSRPEMGYLQITLRHLVTILGQLYGTVSVLRSDREQEALLRQIDVIGGLRKTVRVLEQTREHFRSRELGELRRELEDLLRRIDEAEAPGAPGR
jgi:DNA-binding response OmpR family regulator